MAYIYRHIRLDKNEPFYIGIGSDDNYKRAYSEKNRNKYWKNIIGATKYEVEVMLDDLTWKEVCEKEKEFIALYGRKDQNKGPLCNYTDGGEGVLGLIVSQESREKMRKAQTGKIHSPEQIAKRAAKMSGAGNPWYGKTFSEEYKQKLSAAKKGKKRDVEVMKRLHKSIQKQVIDLATGKVYESIDNLAIAVNAPASTVSRWVRRPDCYYKILEKCKS